MYEKDCLEVREKEYLLKSKGNLIPDRKREVTGNSSL